MIEHYIEKIDLFKGLGSKSLKRLGALCRLKSYASQTHLFLEGEEGRDIFFLVDGAVQLYKLNAEGKEVVIKIVDPGELFAEVILFEKSVFPVNALTLAASKVLRISKEGILHLLEEEDFRSDFIAALMHKQRYLKERIHFLTACSIEERLRLFLEQRYGRQTKIECNLTKKDLAATLGVTPESLSRLLSRLAKSGILEWKKKQIAIKREFWEAGCSNP